jgi:hypothetical protein
MIVFTAGVHNGTFANGLQFMGSFPAGRACQGAMGGSSRSVDCHAAQERLRKRGTARHGSLLPAVLTCTDRVAIFKRDLPKNFYRLQWPAGPQPAFSLNRPGSDYRAPYPAQQNQHDRKIQQVPRGAVDEGGMVRTGQIEDLAGHPSAQCHAQQGEHDHCTDPSSRLCGGKMFTDDDCIRRHNAALKQAEQRSNDIQRRQPIERQAGPCRDARRSDAGAIADDRRRIISASAVMPTMLNSPKPI